MKAGLKAGFGLATSLTISDCSLLTVNCLLSTANFFNASFSATNCSYNSRFSWDWAGVRLPNSKLCVVISKVEKSYSEVIVKHSVGQTVVQSPQNIHFAISISNLAAKSRIAEPSEAYPAIPVALIGSISIQSTGQTFAHLSQTIQSSISLCN